MEKKGKGWEEVLRRGDDDEQIAGTGQDGPADNRPLYDRLQERRAKEQADYLEKLRVQNRAATLRPEDVEYLEDLERRRREREEVEKQQELEMISAFKKQQKRQLGAQPETKLERANTVPAKSAGIEKKRATFGIAPKKRPSDGKAA